MARNVPGEPYTRISAEEAHEMLNAGEAVMIDVRRQDEYEGAHVKNAILIPVDDVIPRFDELPTEGKLLFICEVGARSGLAAEYAAAMGAEQKEGKFLREAVASRIAFNDFDFLQLGSNSLFPGELRGRASLNVPRIPRIRRAP